LERNAYQNNIFLYFEKKKYRFCKERLSKTNVLDSHGALKKERLTKFKKSLDRALKEPSWSLNRASIEP
jgi:hypothetical protein